MSRKRLRRDQRAAVSAKQHVRASVGQPSRADTGADTDADAGVESYSHLQDADALGFDSGTSEGHDQSVDVLESSEAFSTTKYARSERTAASNTLPSRQPSTRPPDVASAATAVRVSASASMLRTSRAQDEHDTDALLVTRLEHRRDTLCEAADRLVPPYNLFITHVHGIPQHPELRIQLTEPEGTIAEQTASALRARGFELSTPNSLEVVTSGAMFYGADLAKSVIAHPRVSSGDKIQVNIIGLELSTQQKHEVAVDRITRLMTPITPEREPFKVISSIRLLAKEQGKSQRKSNPSVITIPAHWPGSQTRDLFVRPCYPVIYEHILERFSGESRRFVAFTGQPGIGKTMFGWYCLYRLVTEQPEKSILYIDGEANEIIFIPSFQAPISFAPLSHSLMQTLGALCEVVYISDSRVIPRVYNSCGLVLGSPRVFRVDRARSLVKRYSPGRTFYFPIPDQEELMRMYKFVYPRLSEAGVIRRIEFWGAIPRFVFSQVSDIDQRGNADELCEVSEDQLLALLDKQYDLSATLHKDSPHRLLHEYALGQHKSTRPTKFKYYRRGLVLPASDILATLVQSLISKYQHEKIVWLTDIARERGALSTLRGFLFEYQVLAVLEVGGTFKARKLLPKGTTTDCPPDLIDITFPRQQRRLFARGALKGAVADGHLLVPDSQNHPVCDAFVWDPIRRHHCPINSTVATRHDINAAYLHKSLVELGILGKTSSIASSDSTAGHKRVPFFWIVPSDVAPEWKVEMPLGTYAEREGGQAACTKLSTCVEQYVVAVTRIDALTAYQRLLKDPRKKIAKIARSLGE